MDLEALQQKFDTIKRARYTLPVKDSAPVLSTDDLSKAIKTALILTEAQNNFAVYQNSISLPNKSHPHFKSILQNIVKLLKSDKQIVEEKQELLGSCDYSESILILETRMKNAGDLTGKLEFIISELGY